VTLEEALAKARTQFDDHVASMRDHTLGVLRAHGATDDEVAIELARIDQDIVQARRAMVEYVTSAFVTNGETMARFQ